ncbi:FAS1 domain-containing protein [Guyanagaster necrorhizus]|uniref:FAS1 domain-containing protein n=1 Tax=Guyanagaster necrorhizus TaxID=856835 RepID=A0A9P7W633_9AGAR|nr:FAS1 domain-containing protein [Guyanagaster necrorhizus MCA 3950]KAG7452909.1 FAS1 domain-containing protein [Guyanagaster necrorhizus MCA 3950]
MVFQNLALVVLSGVLFASALPEPFVRLDAESLQRPLQSTKAHVQKFVSDGDGPLTSENKTIYEAITGDPRFSRLTKAIKFSNDIIDQLNDSSSRITFFATPDWALRKPEESALQGLFRYDGDVMQAQPEMYDLSTAIHAYEELANIESFHDDSEKKRWKRFLRMLVRVILSYHIIPGQVDTQKLSEVSTYPTNLSLHFAMHDEPQRIRVESSLIPPRTTVNFYSKVVSANTKTANGLIHVVNHPLIPPITAFRELYMAPSMYSIFTSAWQRSGLTDELDLRWVHGKGDKKGHIEGTSVATVFVPSNHAFGLLPKQLQYYLFSPFGAHTLKKLLRFHVIPNLSLHTDYIYNASSHHKHSVPRVYRTEETYDDPLDQFLAEIIDTEEYFVANGYSELISSFNVTALTLLPKHPITINIMKYNVTLPFPGPRRPHHIITKMYANGQRVAVPDIVALNGAMHSMGTLLDPRKTGHDNGRVTDWEGWEDWLPKWAMEV